MVLGDWAPAPVGLLREAIRGAGAEAAKLLLELLGEGCASTMTSRANRMPGGTHSHERVLLWPTHFDDTYESWVILTADDDLYIERVRDWTWIYDLTEGWPPRLRGGVVRFRTPLTANEVLAKVLEGRDEALKYRAKRRLPERLCGRLGEEPTTFLDWRGRELVVEDSVLNRVRRRLTNEVVSSELRLAEASGDELVTRPALGGAADGGAGGAGGEAGALVPASPAAAPDGRGGAVLEDGVYVVAEVRAPNGMQLGDPVVGGQAESLGGCRAVVLLDDGARVLCERVAADDVAGRGAAGQVDDLRAEFAAADAGVDKIGGTATPVSEAEAEGDARVLCVEWASEGVRFKTWRKAVEESTQLTMEQCELRGACAFLHPCRRFLQHTGGPKMWLLSFCRGHGISSKDRSCHELTALVQALWLAGTYDGLNLGGVAALESVARRLVTIVEARRNGPALGQASWESARYLSFANRVARGEAERHLAKTRGRAAGARQEFEETGAAPALGGLPGAKEEAKGDPEGAAAKAGRAKPRLATAEKVAGLRRDAQRGAQLAAAGWGRPSSAGPSQRALPQLLRGHAPCGAEPRANLASFARDWLGIPGNDEALGPVRPYADPVLRSNRKVYVGRVKRLIRIGLVRLGASKKCDVGVFVVKNDGAQQKLILDCQASDRQCVAPPSVGLLTGEGLSRVGRQAGGRGAVCLGASDVEDCFHRLRFPKDSKLDEYFACP
ncbi:unnamed protein product [Prorocentrum cordatum]|uniref:Uncharacterized protein n=1 Tax=Prorocentrum cordatum TaxID=2364126 RepID=A0ABN9T7G2_9DINO|nr:unnamed protein product [Polarella glacialis]